jgi:hypothetical protein
MKRRQFITLLGGAAAPSILWPLGSRAQPSGGTLRVGYLTLGQPEDTREEQARHAALLDALGKLGWAFGRNKPVSTLRDPAFRPRHRSLAQSQVQSRPVLAMAGACQ